MIFARRHDARREEDGQAAASHDAELREWGPTIRQPWATRRGLDLLQRQG